MRAIGKAAGMRQATAALLLAVLSQPVLAQEPKWSPHIDLEAKPGTRRALGEGDAFIPLAQDGDTLLFANLRYRFDDSDGNEGNYGLGVRHMLEGGWNIGGYGYFDRRRTEYGNYFNQATFGVEALSQDWDLRANYYAPVGRRSHQVDSLSTAEVSGTTVIFRGGEERSMGGFDAELGWRAPLFDAGADKQFRIYGGGYRFTEDNVPTIQGPRARAELTFDFVPYLWEGSRFSLGAEWQHDDPRGSQGFLTARLRIPLQVYGKLASTLTPMERRMADPVVRDIDVVSQAGAFGTPETTTQFANGGSFTLLTGGADLMTAVAAAGNNSTVLLSGTFNTGTVITLQSGQTVTAGAVQVRSPSGRTAMLTTSATINSGLSGATVEMGANSTLNGLNLVMTGGGSIGVNIGAAGATVSNNTISAVTGIFLYNGGTNATISGNTISGDSVLIIQAISAAIDATVNNNRLIGNFWHTRLDSTFFGITLTGTGNVVVSGACLSIGGNTTGSIGYTNGTTCP